MAALAQLVAASAMECHQVVVDSHGMSLALADIRPTAWLKLYRQPLRLEDAIWQILLPSDSRNERESSILSASVMRREMMAALRLGVEKSLTKGVTQREVDRAHRMCELLYRMVHLPMMRRWLTTDDVMWEPIRDWLYRRELIFFLLIAMPCWLEYRHTPWELFQRARRGDFQALEKLIRLDPEVDKEATLQAVVFRIRTQNRAQYNLLQEARFEGRTKLITLADIKYSLGGLLMKWSQELERMLRGEILFQAIESNTTSDHRGEVRRWIKAQRKQAERNGIKCRLKAPDINELFNAVARDRAQGLNDPDFSGQPNSIYKRLERNAKRWPSLQETDISRAA